MDFRNSNDPRRHFKDKRSKLRPQTSHPSFVLPPNQIYHPPQWGQSAVNIAPTTSMMRYDQPPPAPLHVQPQARYPTFQQQAWASSTNLTTLPHSIPIDGSSEPAAQENHQDVVSDRLSEIIALIDEDTYTESGKEVVITIPQTPPPAYTFPLSQNGESERSLVPHRKPGQAVQRQQNRNINVLSRLSYYSNSRLPSTLPPFRVYISTYPLLCLAALCSANAYHYRQNAVKDEQLISADARIGTKAMVIKSVTCADEKTIVFAIRGTSVLSLRDWNVNLNTQPESPSGFLDDDGNYCHAGFLRVAKVMVKPIAARLRHLLEENPNRLSYSLLITGHSAGGAVASLLYAHMMSEHIQSELTILADCFKRVHCVTFGAPPISLLPLQKPTSKRDKLEKCLFHSIINEGDPVVRAEKSYIMSLVDLLTTTPASASSLLTKPKPGLTPNFNTSDLCETSMSLLKITNLGLFTGPKKPKRRTRSVPLPPRPHQSNSYPPGRVWAVPPGTLSNAGRLVVLRGPEPPANTSGSQVDLSQEFEEVRAFTATDEQIRKVIFGDPLMHGMDVYRRRIEALAMKAVTGRDRFY